MQLYGARWAPPFLPPFKVEEQELQFQNRQSVEDRRLDQLAGVMCFVCSLHASYKHGAKLTTARLLQSLAVAPIFLVPWLWCSLLKKPESYTQNRLWIVAGLRILPDWLVPSVEDVFPTDAPTLQSPLGHALYLLLFLKLPNAIFGVVGFRLPFYLHLAVHAVPLARYLQNLRQATCALPFFQTPPVLRLLGATRLLFSWAGALTYNEACFEGGYPTAGASLGEDPGGGRPAMLGTLCSCVQVMAALRVCVHYLLPTFLVVVRERWARVAFLASRGQEGRWAFRQGDHSKLAWAASLVMLLPLVLGSVWHLVLLRRC